MSAPRSREVNPYAAPEADEPPPTPDVELDAQLRHEYLGAVLLAAVSGALAAVMFLASNRWPTSDFGEAMNIVTRVVSYLLAVVSLMFVFITLKAAVRRVLLLAGRIRSRKK